MREMELRVTELADYLQLSRPTMYKFIDLYDNGEFDLVNPKVLKLFNYISENELAGKKAVIAYILNNLVELKPMADKSEAALQNKIRKYLISNPQSKKSLFLEFMFASDKFDPVISYLCDIHGLISKRKLTDEEALLISPYKELLEKIKNFK